RALAVRPVHPRVGHPPRELRTLRLGAQHVARRQQELDVDAVVDRGRRARHSDHLQVGPRDWLAGHRPSRKNILEIRSGNSEYPLARDDAPVTGAWRPGDHPGRRAFVTLFEDQGLPLELGGSFGPVTVAYETWGRRSPAGDNAVLVLHALTGDSHVSGDAGPGHPTAGWWGPIVGPGGAIDTDRWWVVCPNTLGGCQGTTGPASDAPDGTPWGARFPAITTRDQVAVEAALADALGIRRWAAVVGGSMGGMRALEWGVTYPDRVERMIVLGCGAAATAEQIALCTVQARAIRLDPGFRGGDYYALPPGEGPSGGLGLARRIGHISYRSEIELHARFARMAQDDEDP